MRASAPSSAPSIRAAALGRRGPIWSATRRQWALAPASPGWAKARRGKAGTSPSQSLGARACRLRVKCTRQRRQAAVPSTWVIAASKPAWLSEITSRTPDRPLAGKERRNSTQNPLASGGPMPSPRISRRPSRLTPVATVAATAATRPPSRALRQAQVPPSGRSRNSCALASNAWQSSETLSVST